MLRFKASAKLTEAQSRYALVGLSMPWLEPTTEA